MADATLSSKQFFVLGNKRAAFGAMLLSGTHGANGYGATAGQLGLTKVEAIHFDAVNANCGKYVPIYSAGYVSLIIATQQSTCTAGVDLTSTPCIYNYFAIGV